MRFSTVHEERSSPWPSLGEHIDEMLGELVCLSRAELDPVKQLVAK